MRNFAGYEVEVRDKDIPYPYRVIDLKIATLTEKGVPIWRIPHNDLHAAGEAQMSLTNEELGQFQRGEIIFVVKNITSGQERHYDEVSMDHELEMERICG